MQKFGLLLSLLIISSTSFSQNKFAFDMYAGMEKEKNVLFSPTSIKSAFAMAYEGANTATQKEFEHVFDFKEDNADFFKEIDHLKTVAQISNSIWILDDFKILKSYTDKIESSFNSKPNYTDFKNDSKGSADKINQWIEKSTNGMIKKMLKPSDVQAFKMALVNAVYFKQNWKKPFVESATQKKDFKNIDGAKVEVDMMRALSYYKAFEGQKEKVIELPYEDDKTSMVIILPNNMNRYKMTDEVYTELTAKIHQQKVNLEVPKFTFETPTFKLKPFLNQIGLVTAFEDSADFSGMRKERDLKIGTALHKAKIIVNEKGTEAAAATVIGMVRTTSAPSRPIPIMQFKADKPFFYFIKDQKTNTILFMGRMNKM